MPVLRYFVCVGGVLLALLLIANAYLPKLPVEASADTGIDKSTIRIHSERKWPERVVFDTSLPTVVLQETASAAPAPAAAPSLADISTSSRARDAFAQLQPSDQKPAQLSDPRKPEKPAQRKRKIAKRRAAPPVMLVAQQPQFSLFGNNTW